MTVTVEVLSEVTSEVVEAFGRLLPQLSASAEPLDAAAVGAIIAGQASTILVARAADHRIAGTLTLVMFRIPTGQRARIEDVVVDQAARRQGIAEALTREALRLARQAGIKNVDLTSRPSRQEAGRLYQRLGFEQRESRMYRYTFS